MNCKRLALVSLFMLLVFPVFGSMVTFLVIETGLNEEFAATQHSSLWEDALMAEFFEAGHIVTNYPVARMEKKPEMDLVGKIGIDFYDAMRGGSDYFILGFLEYKIQGDAAAPVAITIKLYETRSEMLVFEHNFPAGGGKSLGEEYLAAQNAARVLVSNIKG